MIAGDSKIWIMALFLLASYIYKAIKKRKEQDKEGGQSPVLEEDSSGDSWGMDDLIKEFEQSYGGAGIEKPISVDNTDKHSFDSESEDKLGDNGGPSVEKFEEELSLSEKRAQKAFEEAEKNNKKTKLQVFSEEVEEDYSLRDMVISKVILDRPEY